MAAGGNGCGAIEQKFGLRARRGAGIGGTPMHVGFLTLSLLLSQAPVPQVPVVALPCLPGDSTLVCHCKAGFVDSCAALAEADLAALRGLLRAAEMVKAAQEEGEKAKAKSTDVVDTGCGTGQDPNNDDQTKCEGQLHHIISKAVWRALKEHLVLRGLYQYRDPHFVVQAKDLKAHCGYQHWHRDIDREIADWLKDHGEATAEQFEAYLREVYGRQDLQERFPNGF